MWTDHGGVRSLTVAALCGGIRALGDGRGGGRRAAQFVRGRLLTFCDFNEIAGFARQNCAAAYFVRGFLLGVVAKLAEEFESAVPDAGEAGLLALVLGKGAL